MFTKHWALLQMLRVLVEVYSTCGDPCRLYTDVITTITGYGNLLWVDVVAQIDAMNERVLTFQGSSKKLPKGLREWPAYLECKRTIDDFLLVLPLFRQLTHKALRPR